MHFNQGATASKSGHTQACSTSCIVHCTSVGIPRLNIFRTQLGVIMIPSNQQNQTPNQNKIKMIPQSQGVDLLLFRPFKIRIFA